MSSFIKKLALFSIVSFAMYVVLICVWGEMFPSAFRTNIKYKKGSYGHLFTRSNEAKETENVDVLFLGSSHAYRGFDPRIFASEGITTFNLGSSAQAHTVTNGLLRRYLDNLNPELVVYEVWPKTFMNDGIESTLDVIANDSIDMITLDLVVQSGSILTFNAFIYGLYTDIFKGGRNFRENIIRMGNDGGDKYIKGGFVEKIDYSVSEPEINVLTEWRNEQFEAFRENLELLRDSGARVVLVMAPVRQLAYDSLYEINWFNNQMQQAGDYYNYTERLHLDDHYFYDQGHLTQDGIEIFNNQLIRDLEEDNMLNPQQNN